MYFLLFFQNERTIIRIILFLLYLLFFLILIILIIAIIVSFFRLFYVLLFSLFVLMMHHLLLFIPWYIIFIIFLLYRWHFATCVPWGPGWPGPTDAQWHHHVLGWILNTLAIQISVPRISIAMLLRAGSPNFKMHGLCRVYTRYIP
jgi:hypothetical protein